MPVFIEAAIFNDIGKPDTTQYLAWSNSLRLDLQALGLERRKKGAMSLAEYMARFEYSNEEEK